MGLDWGGFDILRDRADGQNYIVDVNKTDLEPVIALCWADKLRSMHRLSQALSALVEPAAEADGRRGSRPATAFVDHPFRCTLSLRLMPLSGSPPG